MCETKLVAVHKWEERGLWKAPFKVIAVISMPAQSLGESNPNGFQNAMAEAQFQATQWGVALGSCDVCGTGIHNHFVIADSAGHRFVVGCDCVMKTDDTKLMTEAKAAERKRLRAARQKKAEEQREIDRLDWVARLEAERAANGGLTNGEVIQRAKDEEKRQIAIKFSAENDWLLKVIRGMSGDFIDSMVEQLETGPIRRLSDRCVSILGEIYAKSNGRRGSKAFNAAVDEFTVKSDIHEDDVTEGID